MATKRLIRILVASLALLFLWSDFWVKKRLVQGQDPKSKIYSFPLNKGSHLSAKLSNQKNLDGSIARQVKGKICIFDFWLKV